MLEQVYNSLGQKTKLIDEAGNETLYEYDDFGRLTRILLPDGGETTYEYDAKGNKVLETKKVTYSQNYIVKYEYDEMNRLTQTIEDFGGKNITTTRAYDILGRLTSITDSKGGITSYEYDEMGRITKETYPDNGEIIKEYDLKGRLIREVKQDGAEINFTYDSRDLLIAREYGSMGEQGYEYDVLRRMTKSTDNNMGQNLVTVEYAYDALNRQISESQQLNSGSLYTIGRDYDKMGRIIRTTHPGGRVIERTYTVLGQPDKIFTTSGTQMVEVADYDYGYDVGGSDIRPLLKSESLLPGIERTINHDEVGRITVNRWERDGSLQVGFTHSYDLS